MKHKIFLGLTLSFLNLFVSAQETIAIPDVALEEALIDLKIDTNGLNGNILVSDAKYVVNLNIFNPLENKELPNVHSKIKDLTGIENFPNLKKLVCYGNEISKIDVSKNKNLVFLNCSDNKILTLDVSQNSKLRLLSCEVNYISSLILGHNGDLSELYCNSNKLTSLDLKNITKLRDLDISGNPLKEVTVNPVTIKSIPEGWFKDDSTQYVTELGQKISKNTPSITITNSKIAPLNTSKKIIDENFKKTVILEFEKKVLEDSYINKKLEEVRKKYNLTNNQLKEWLEKYSKVIQLKNSL